MKIQVPFKREGFETSGSGTLYKEDMKQIEGRRELQRKQGVYFHLSDGVTDVEDGAFLLIPNLSEIEISDTVSNIPVSKETLKHFKDNNVIISGGFDTYAERFAKQYELCFIHPDIVLGEAGDYFEHGIDIVTLHLRFYGPPRINQDCRCQGISAGNTGGGEIDFYLPEDFYKTMSVKDVADMCWGTCYDKIMNNEKFRAFMSRAKKKNGYRFDFRSDKKG